MMELSRHEGWYLELCRHNRAVLETPTVKEDPEKRHTALSRAVLYLILAPHEPEQAYLTHRLLADKMLEEIPIYKYDLYIYVYILILSDISSLNIDLNYDNDNR